MATKYCNFGTFRIKKFSLTEKNFPLNKFTPMIAKINQNSMQTTRTLKTRGSTETSAFTTILVAIIFDTTLKGRKALDARNT